jgi:hypothetical protein
MKTNYNEMWKCEATDKFVKNYQLQGEGRWFESYVYVDTKGNEYEVWVDQDGDSKIL